MEGVRISPLPVVTRPLPCARASVESVRSWNSHPNPAVRSFPTQLGCQWRPNGELGLLPPPDSNKGKRKPAKIEDADSHSIIQNVQVSVENHFSYQVPRRYQT